MSEVIFVSDDREGAPLMPFDDWVAKTRAEQLAKLAARLDELGLRADDPHRARAFRLLDEAMTALYIEEHALLEAKRAVRH